MKTTKQLFAFLIVLMLTAGTLFAQDQNKGISLSDDHVMNLVSGINSNNEGLKRSAIYLAGKYGIEDLTFELVKRLKTEKNAQDRILISLALYKIGGRAGYEAVKEIANNDYNAKVRRISNAICDAFELENDRLIADN